MVVELVIAGTSLVLAVIAVLGYLASRKQLRMLSKAVDALVSLAKTQRKQVKALSPQGQRTESLKEQELLLRKQRQDWEVLKGIGKALGWARDRGLFDDEDEGT